MASTVMLPVSLQFLQSPDRRSRMGSVIQALWEKWCQFCICLLNCVQEAYKAVEDIHSLIVLAKKPPRPSLMSNYLQKFGLVLYKSDNFMFHACAWHRLFHLYREQRKSVSEHELQKSELLIYLFNYKIVHYTLYT